MTTRLRIREHASHRELEVRHGVGDDRRAALPDELELVVVEPHAVSEDGPWCQQADPVEVRRGPDTVRGHAILHLAFGLREMDVHADVTLRRQVGNPMQRLLADQVDGVRPQRGRDAGTGVGEGIERPLGVGAQGIRLAGVEAVDERECDRRADAGVLDGAADGFGLPVHVPEPHRPRADHLDAREARAPVHVVGGELGLGGPDPVLEPRHQWKVVAVAAHQGHRRVRVAVDQARQNRHARGVQHVVAGRRLDACAERDDLVRLDAHGDDGAVEPGVPHGQAHELPAS